MAWALPVMVAAVLSPTDGRSATMTSCLWVVSWETKVLYKYSGEKEPSTTTMVGSWVGEPIVH